MRGGLVPSSQITKKRHLLSDAIIGIIICGVAPSIILGLFIVLQKMATRKDAKPGDFLIILGMVSACIEGVLLFTANKPEFTFTGTLWTIRSSACWGLSMAEVAYILSSSTIPQ